MCSCCRSSIPTASKQIELLFDPDRVSDLELRCDLLDVLGVGVLLPLPYVLRDPPHCLVPCGVVVLEEVGDKPHPPLGFLDPHHLPQHLPERPVQPLDDLVVGLGPHAQCLTPCSLRARLADLNGMRVFCTVAAETTSGCDQRKRGIIVR